LLHGVCFYVDDLIGRELLTLAGQLSTVQHRSCSMRHSTSLVAIQLVKKDFLIRLWNYYVHNHNTAPCPGLDLSSP
jgi:hypothetical protein